MWNNILFFACIWFCACSTMDPEIPDYESLENDPLPIATIKSASPGFFAGGNAEHCFVTYEQPDTPPPLFMLRERFGPAGHLAT